MERKRFEIPSPCGISCDSGKCMYFTGKKEPQCPGCISCAGKPFWGECKVHKCTTGKKIEHCGICDEFPCKLLIDQYDPSNPRGKEEAIFRIGQLAIRSKIGTKAWLSQLGDGTLTLFDVEN